MSYFLRPLKKKQDTSSEHYRKLSFGKWYDQNKTSICNDHPERNKGVSQYNLCGVDDVLKYHFRVVFGNAFYNGKMQL